MHPINTAPSLVEQTYEALLDAICAGELRPGERIGQDEIAERLNVSRQPVNSAIAMLKTQRFVADTGRRGVIVAPVDPDHFRSIYQVRAVLEPLAVELAAQRLTANAIERGRKTVAHGQRMMRTGDARSVLRADMEFHMLIYELSGNSVIVDSMRLNWLHIRRAMGEVLRHPGMSAHVWREHSRIWEAMAAGKADEASAMMRGHIVQAVERVGGFRAPE